MNDLPKEIQVKMKQNKKTGVFVAKLPEYDLFTESDSFSGLLFMVNDLIYTFFDIPESMRGKIWYSPPLKKQIEHKLPINPILFSALTTSNSNKNFIFQ